MNFLTTCRNSQQEPSRESLPLTIEQPSWNVVGRFFCASQNAAHKLNRPVIARYQITNDGVCFEVARSPQFFGSETPHCAAVGLGSRPPTARFTCARVCSNGNQPTCLAGTSLLNPLSHRQCHRQATHASSRATHIRCVARDRNSRNHVVLTDTAAV
jgi:hypothetical protein